MSEALRAPERNLGQYLSSTERHVALEYSENNSLRKPAAITFSFSFVRRRSRCVCNCARPVGYVLEKFHNLLRIRFSMTRVNGDTRSNWNSVRRKRSSWVSDGFPRLTRVNRPRPPPAYPPGPQKPGKYPIKALKGMKPFNFYPSPKFYGISASAATFERTFSLLRDFLCSATWNV